MKLLSFYFVIIFTVYDISYAQKRHVTPISLKSFNTESSYQIFVSNPRISSNEDGRIIYPPYFVKLPHNIDFYMPLGVDWFFGTEGEVITISYNIGSGKYYPFSAGYLETKDASFAFDELKELTNNHVICPTKRTISNRVHYFIRKDLFYIKMINIKKSNLGDYIRLLRQIESIENDVSYLVDSRLDSIIYNKPLLSEKREALFNTDHTKSFLIEDIKQISSNMFFIRAKRNDSTFFICSYDNLNHIVKSETMQIGKCYDISLEQLWNDYSVNIRSRHIEISRDRFRFFFGWKENHFMIYFAKDINGIHLEF